jgi:hypothetical protein
LLNFLYLAGGLAVLLVALFLCYALFRLGRTLARLEEALLLTEETLLTANSALKVVIPEVRDSLGHVNGVLRTAGAGATRLTEAAGRSQDRVSAALYGARVAAASLWGSFGGHERPNRGDESDGR